MQFKESSFESRFAAALQADHPKSALTALARASKDEGIHQDEVYNLYLRQLRRHLGSADNATYDQISEVMDTIAGRCDKSLSLFEARL